MFENITKFLKKFSKNNEKTANNSKNAAKERLHLVLMQDRANVSADFLELMKQEIIDVIKKYIDVDETAIDVRLTNKDNGDGTNGAPALYANIPIINIKNEARKVDAKKDDTQKTEKQESKEKEIEDKKEDDTDIENKTETEKKEVKEEKVEVNTSEEEQDTNKEVDIKEDETKEKIKSKNN